MDEQQPTGNVVKGKDLPGAINLMAGGLGSELGNVLKKRESREIKMENTSSGMSFSTGVKGGGEIQQSFSSMKSSKESSSSFSSSISGPGPLQQQQQFSASGMSSSMQQQKTTSTSFSSSSSMAQSSSQSFMQQGQATQQPKKILQQQPAQQQQASIQHGEEIKQESLKTTLQSAITDLEQDIDTTVVDSGDKENQAPPPQQQQAIPEIVEVAAPPASQPQNGHVFEEYKHGPSDFDKKLKWPREFTGRPDSSLGMEDYVPSDQNLIGVPDFSELDGSGKMTEQFHSEQSMSMQKTTSTSFNGHAEQQESQQQQSFQSTAISNNPMLEKALAPPSNDADYDSNSLKRRNPRQMFTDSAFYSPKHHPSVADQVEMAHQLSSSLYNEGNKMSKGQEMYLKRAKTSGDTSDIEASLQQPGDKPLNLKLVLNPAGKVHDWTDLPEEEIPELQQIATGGLNPEAARQMVENLQACKGKGKMRGKLEMQPPSNKNTCPSVTGHATRNTQPNVSSFGAMSSSGWPAQNGKTFQSSYAEVFKNRRGIFEQGNTYESKNYKTLDDLSLPVSRVSSFSKPSKPVTKAKGSNRVQFEDDKGNNDKSHIANHYGKRVSDSDKINSDTINLNHNDLKKSNNMTQNTETNNPDTSHTPFWKPLSRSRTAPNLVSSSGALNSIRNYFDGKHNSHSREQKQAQTSDHPMAVNNAMEDNMIVPKAPARKISSHKSVVQFKKSKVEVDDTEKFSSPDLRPDFRLNKNNLTNKNIKHQKRQSNDDSCEDEGADFNWRPLRDFF